MVGFRIALEPVIEWGLPRLLEQQLGARAAVANVDLGLIAGEVTLEGVRIDAASGAGAPPLLQLDRWHVQLSWPDLLERTLRLTAVELDGAQVRLVQQRDGSLALPTPPAAPPEQTELAAADEPIDAPENAEAATGEPDGSASPGDASVSEPGEPEWVFAVDRLALHALDFQLHSESLDKEVIAFSAALLSLTGFSLGPGAIGLEDVSLEKPALDVDRSWLLEPSPATTEPEADESGASTVFRVQRFAFDSGRFHIRTANGPVEASVKLGVEDMSTAEGAVFPFSIEIGVDEGRTALDGRLGLIPLFYEGRLSWSNLSVPPYLLLTTPGIVPWLQSASADGDMQVTFRSDSSQGTPGLTMHGQTNVSKLVFRDPESDELAVELERVEIVIREAFYPLEFSPSTPRRIELTRATFDQPRIVFTNPPDALDRLLAAAEAGAPAGEPTEAEAPESPGAEPEEPENPQAPEEPEQSEAVPPPLISIDALDVRGGALLLVDRSVSPTHRTRISELRFTAENVTTDPFGARKLDVAGLIQDRGTFTLRGGVRDGAGELHFDLSHLDLVSYDPFARNQGWRIASGDASLTSGIQIERNRYLSQNDLVLHDLRVDPQDAEAFSSAFGVSVDFALALLRGPSGDIEFQIPVTWQESGVDVNVGRIVRDALRKALVGALSSPLKLIGVVRRGEKSASVDPIAFRPGSAELDAAGVDRLDGLAALLAERPSLALSLLGESAATDEPILARALLRETVAAGGDLPEVEDSGIFARRRIRNALAERAAGGPGALDAEDEALLARYVEATAVPAERALALARSRSEAVRQALLAKGLPEEAVTLDPPRSGETPGVALKLRVRAALTATPPG